MTKQELSRLMAENSELSAKQCNQAINALGNVIRDQLMAGGEVVVPGIGKFAVADRAARTGRNPQTGEAIEIAAKRVPTFSAAKVLKDAVAT